MEKIFQDILDLDGVDGLILLAQEGKIIFEAYSEGKAAPESHLKEWKNVVESLGQIQEVDLVYASGRVYIRQIENGYFVVCMEREASVAMIKLNCDIVIPEIKLVKTSLAKYTNLYRANESTVTELKTNKSSSKGLKKFFGF